MANNFEVSAVLVEALVSSISSDLNGIGQRLALRNIRKRLKKHDQYLLSLTLELAPKVGRGPFVYEVEYLTRGGKWYKARCLYSIGSDLKWYGEELLGLLDQEEAAALVMKRKS